MGTENAPNGKQEEIMSEIIEAAAVVDDDENVAEDEEALVEEAGDEDAGDQMEEANDNPNANNNGNNEEENVNQNARSRSRSKGKTACKKATPSASKSRSKSRGGRRSKSRGRRSNSRGRGGRSKSPAAVVDPSPAALRNAVEDPDREAHPRRKSHQRSGRAQKVALARSPNVDQLDMLQKAVLAAALHLRARAKAKPRANSRYVTVDITRESRRKFYTPPATRDRQFSSQNTSGVDPGTQYTLQV